MQSDQMRDLLEQVKRGKVSVESALAQLDSAPVADLGFANVDLQRRARCGFPEVIFCEGKAPQWVEGVVRKLVEARQDCLATRVSEDQAAHLARLFPEGRQDRVARTFWLPAAPVEPEGSVA